MTRNKINRIGYGLSFKDRKWIRTRMVEALRARIGNGETLPPMYSFAEGYADKVERCEAYAESLVRRIEGQERHGRGRG